MDEQIVSAKIHPAIGIARVGNSPDEFFIGPEVPYVLPNPQGPYKDAQGAIKRQAARFRIYGYNQAGQAVRELTTAEADIRWTVHVANKKAAWYDFTSPLDLPGVSQPTPRRNANIQGAAREELIIDPGPHSIMGGESRAQPMSGRFLGRDVYLGELRSDSCGRLLFLGGHGVSDTVYSMNPAYTWADNYGWFDDISDGPVNAEVTLRGVDMELPVDPAWVVTAPPNFAPDVISIQTMWDVMVDTFNGLWLQPPAKPSFANDVLPLLFQFYNMQWVNFGYFMLFGSRAPNDFVSSELMSRLSSPSPQFAEARAVVFEQFRNPADKVVQPRAWPLNHGDATGVAGDPRSFMSLTQSLYDILTNWANGNFVEDWPQEAADFSQPFDGHPIQEQPALLDKAALYYCSGGPFHPGCEMTWPMRFYSMYRAPFRIRPRAANAPEPDFGDILTPQVALGPNGPLHAQGPGDITRWMAVPWQTDSASCRSGYADETNHPVKDAYLPTFWPARVPNQVLTEKDYNILMDPLNPRGERLDAFRRRAVWWRGLRGQYIDQINHMITDFGKLGIVERRPGPTDPDIAGLIPRELYVESQPGIEGIDEIPLDRNLRTGRVEKMDKLARLLR